MTPDDKIRLHAILRRRADNLEVELRASESRDLNAIHPSERMDYFAGECQKTGKAMMLFELANFLLSAEFDAVMEAALTQEPAKH